MKLFEIIEVNSNLEKEIVYYMGFSQLVNETL